MKNKKLGKLYNDGDIIIKQGTKGKCLYVIQEGKVDVIHETPGGDIKVAELGESDFFGEMGLFEEDVRSCTVRASGHVKILTIDKRNFFKSIAGGGQEDTPSLNLKDCSLLELKSNYIAAALFIL